MHSPMRLGLGTEVLFAAGPGWQIPAGLAKLFEASSSRERRYRIKLNDVPDNLRFAACAAPPAMIAAVVFIRKRLVNGSSFDRRSDLILKRCRKPSESIGAS